MRLVLLALSLISLATPALASGAKPEKAEKEDVGQYVDLVPLALPIVAGGQVRNYIFLRVRVNLTKQADAPKMRDREPYLRDALIRAGVSRVVVALRDPDARVDGRAVDDVDREDVAANTARDTSSEVNSLRS